MSVDQPLLNHRWLFFRVTSFICPGLLALLLSAGTCLSFLSAAETTSSDDVLLATMAELANTDADVRKAALGKLGQSRDARLIPFLTDFSQGSVYRVNDRIVIGPNTREVGDTKVVDLLDPLSRQPSTDRKRGQAVVNTTGRTIR